LFFATLRYSAAAQGAFFLFFFAAPQRDKPSFFFLVLLRYNVTSLLLFVFCYARAT
jgi:hypothetical protein